MIDHSRETQLSLALALIHFAFRKIIQEPDRLLAKRGLGRVHHRVLFFVARRPGLSVGDLLAILDVSKQSLHRPMQDLLRRGMLEAWPDPENRRVKRLHLTARGRAFEAKLSGIQRRLFARAFAAHGPAAEREWRGIMDDLGGGRAEAVLSPFRTASRGGRRRDGRMGQGPRTSES
jgi:DNA-binding MarR family transcriptional regulator